MTYAPLETLAANAARWFAHAQPLARRTVIDFIGSFGNRGNGKYRVELRQGLAVITRYLTTHQLPQAYALLRLDGHYGTAAVLADLAGFTCVIRGKEYSVLDHPLVQARLHLPPDQFQQRPESQIVRSLYDCPEVPVETKGLLCRVVVATHPAGKKKSPVGVTRAGVAYSLFLTNLPRASVYCLRCRRTLFASWCITRLRSRTKIGKSIPTAGAVIRPLDRKLGSAWPNGSLP